MPKPLAALAYDLGMGIHNADLLAWNSCQKIVFDLDGELGADAKFRIHELIEGIADSAFRGVLDGHHAVVDFTTGDDVEDFRDARLGGVLDAGAEFLPGSLVGPCGRGAEVGNGETLFQGE